MCDTDIFLRIGVDPLFVNPDTVGREPCRLKFHVGQGVHR